MLHCQMPLINKLLFPNDVRRTFSSSPVEQNYTLLLSTRSYHRTQIRESAWHNENCTNWQVTKLLKQASCVSQVTELKGDRNINYVFVGTIASQLTPPSMYAGRYKLRVRCGSVQTHLHKAKCLLVQGNEPYQYSTYLWPHGMHCMKFVWMQHMQTKIAQYSTKYINFITGSSRIRGTTQDHNITGIYKVSLLSAYRGSTCVQGTTVSTQSNDASTSAY
jgi:hypothetical protein